MRQAKTMQHLLSLRTWIARPSSLPFCHAHAMTVLTSSDPPAAASRTVLGMVAQNGRGPAHLNNGLLRCCIQTMSYTWREHHRRRCSNAQVQ